MWSLYLVINWQKYCFQYYFGISVRKIYSWSYPDLFGLWENRTLPNNLSWLHLSAYVFRGVIFSLLQDNVISNCHRISLFITDLPCVTRQSCMINASRPIVWFGKSDAKMFVRLSCKTDMLILFELNLKSECIDTKIKSFKAGQPSLIIPCNKEVVRDIEMRSVRGISMTMFTCFNGIS